LIAQSDSVAKRFHGQSALVEPWQLIKVRNRAQSNDQLIVAARVLVMIESVRDDHFFPGKIDRFNFAFEEICSLEHLPKGVHDRGKVQIACRNFVQHGREEEEVLAVHQGDFHAGIPGHGLLEFHRRIQTGEAAAQDQDSVCRPAAHLLCAPLADEQ
jgi:hypothetical protein